MKALLIQDKEVNPEGFSHESCMNDFEIKKTDIMRRENEKVKLRFKAWKIKRFTFYCHGFPWI